MKIWFDLSNSPHINMFHDLIRDLEADGHEIIITSRPLANTVELLDQKGLKHTVVGEHYGKNIYKKIFGYPIRVMQLRKFLKPLQPDLAISQSSFHSPLVATLLGIPSIYTNDNEHAMGNKPSFLFATTILIPENLAVEKVAKLGVSGKKVIQYPGVKEGIYLWSKGEKIQSYRNNNQNKEVNIYIRPEPQTAQYYKGKQNFLDETIIELQNKYRVIVLPRDKNQMEHYKQEKFNATMVPDKPMSFDDIANNCTIFIGAGGSMTRELAILGIPTISVYQDELLDVDDFLLKKGLMLHEPSLNAEKVIAFINSLQNKPPSLELMNKGKLAYDLFKNQILKYNKK
jgi:predicted glycosyltransferase